MKLEFIKNTTGCYNAKFLKGEAIDYKPWFYEWQEMTEKERVKAGIFVMCHGQGEFDVFFSKPKVSSVNGIIEPNVKAITQ